MKATLDNHLLIPEMVFGAFALLMGWIGVRAQTSTENTFWFSQYDSASNAKVAAYLPMVDEVSHRLPGISSFADPAAARAIAHEWIAGAASGRLPPLIPQSYDDNASDTPVRARIFYADYHTAESVQLLGVKEYRAKKYDQAVEDELLAMRTAHITEGFDMFSVFRANVVKVSCYTTIASALPKSTAAIRTRALSELPELLLSKDRLDELILRTRSMFMWHQIESGQPLASTRNTEKDLPLAVFDSPDPSAVENLLKKDAPVENDPLQFTFYQRAKLALSTTRNLADRVAELETRYASPTRPTTS